MITYALGMIFVALQGPPRDSLLAEAVRLAPMRPAEALLRFDTLLQRDSTDLPASWRAAIARNDVALPLIAKSSRLRRDSLLAAAARDARRAVRLAPNDPQALFALALVLGNSALTKGSKEKIRMAVEIRSTALRALAADSTHDGAHHLLGRWHYEIMKLSGIERFIARNVLGGGVLGQASWGEARRELELAVGLDSTRIYHRLDFARILVARKEHVLAEAQLRRLAQLPDRVAADSTYRREALELLGKIAGGSAAPRDDAPLP